MQSLLQDTLKHHLIFFDYQKKIILKIYLILMELGITQIQSIKKFFLNKTNLKVLSELEKKLLIKNVILANSNGLLKNKTFMLTGKLNGISRAEAKSLIEQNSGKIINNVNKKLNYLIAGEKPTLKKINIAKDLNIKVINQAEWLKMLNKGG